MNRSDLDGLGYRGTTVVLTGGASGMGEAATRILSNLGAAVHVLDVTEPKVDCTSFTRLDLSDFVAVREVAATLRDHAPIDFVFPIAGISPHALGARQCMMVNYVGTRLFTEAILPAVREGGAIGLVSSTAARYWQQNLADNLEIVAISDPDEVARFYDANPDKLRDGYSPSKELLIVWIQQAAVRLGEERRIRMNCIAPCPTDTAFMEESGKVLGKEFMDSYPYPLLGRMATAEEQAWSLLLLSSPLNAAVTGSVLQTDQGYAGGLVTGALQPATYNRTK